MSTTQVGNENIRAIQGHTGGDAIALELMGHVAFPIKS